MTSATFQALMEQLSELLMPESVYNPEWYMSAYSSSYLCLKLRCDAFPTVEHTPTLEPYFHFHIEREGEGCSDIHLLYQLAPHIKDRLSGWLLRWRLEGGE